MCQPVLPPLCLSQEAQRRASWCAEEQEVGAAEEEYMSQSSGHQPGPAEPSSAPSASAANLDELIQRCRQLLRRWISQFPAVFEADPLLEQTMGDLWTMVRSDGDETQLNDTCCLSPHVNLSQAPSPSVKKRKVSLIFDHMEPDEMAEHLSFLEFKNFCSVSFLDYHSYVVRGSVRDNPALERSVMMCNGVSQWVQLMILSRHTAQQRAQVFTKFIHVAQVNQLRIAQRDLLFCLENDSMYSSLHPAALSEMTDLLSSRSNYSNYRRVYNECHGFKVPILGVHLKDLISLNEALPDYLDEDKINLSKLQHLYSNINDLLSIHSCSPPFEANKDLLHLLTLSLDLYYTEDEIYELSYTKEPKNPKIQPVAADKPPVVAEWGSGVTPRLDPDTISKHVKQMVDVSSEDDTFVFPQSKDTEHTKATSVCKNAPMDSTMAESSTQTDPGMWTPEKRDKRVYNHNVHASLERQVNTLPQRSRGSSMPVSFLQEKLEELHLYKDKSREPD
ncbi:unnamed protein product [Lampetra planeri]